MKVVAREPESDQRPSRGDPLAYAEPSRPRLASSPVDEEASQPGTTLDARLARLDHQVTSILQLLSHPVPGYAQEAPAADPPPVAISCLGTFRFRVDGNTVEGWRSSKARALFQYLVNHRGRPIPRDALIQALWPDPDAVAAGTSLKVAVHVLRQTLSQAGCDRATLTILAHDCGYQLDAPHLWIDVEEFDRCYALGRSAEAQGRSQRALALYARAADLYHGDFLEELSDDWPMFRREALKDQYLFILTCLAKAAVSAGDYQGGIVRCQQLLERDRCREDAYRLLMICHARLGQRSRVRTWYQFCVETLRAELDCGPEPETERLCRLALAGRL
ncbi:MAG TPA: BTAD domain-containing putative transcriptional regulator [Chloroflexota bacterium]|nr:BTAD domain-containing putative transcriptional regulator [Chloroflexota bacterium]